MKLYVITIDEVFRFETFNHEPIAFLDKKKARDKFEDMREDARRIFAEDEWETSEGENFYETYPDGRWSESHYGVYLKEIDVEE